MSSFVGSEKEKRLRDACFLVEDRILKGETHVAMQLLREYPELASDDESIVELFNAEYVALDGAGRRPSAEFWLAQFSTGPYAVHRDRMERLLRLHDLLSDSPVSLGQSSDLREIDVCPDWTQASEGSISSVPTGLRTRHQRSTLDDVSNQPFEHYELLQEIGRGGMGIVYLARQRQLERLVAVKVLRATAIRESERARFQREAALAANLQHPNIVQVIEVSLEAGSEFLSMEYISGGSLDERMSGQRWSNHEIASLMRTLAEAVHYAHERGVVHRDIKPANILFTSQSTPKLVDFGLAKRTQLNPDVHMVHGPQDKGGRDDSRSRAPSEGLIGTPSYMSPEQAIGSEAEIGPSTDIYSLGVVLYEMLTGRLPFEGKTTVETLRWIVDRECEPPSRLQAHVPRDLETICLKCLSKSPSGRYSSAEDLADDLSRFLDHRPILARRIGWLERLQRHIKRHPQVAVLVAFILYVTIGAGGLLYFQRMQMEQMSREVIDTKRIGDLQQQRASEAESAHEETLMKARELVKQWSLIGIRLENEPGMDGLRRKAFEDAVAYYEDFLSTNRGNETIRSEAAQAAVRAAQIHMDLGLVDHAETELRRADQWLADQDATASVLWQRSDGLIQLAHALRRRDRGKEAEQTYRQAITMVDSLLKTSPENTRYLVRKANALINLCVVLRTENRNIEAVDTYLVALRMYLKASFVRIEAVPTEFFFTDYPSCSSDFAVFEGIFISHMKEISNLLSQCEGQTEDKIRILAQEHFLPEIALCLDDLSTLLKMLQNVELAETSIRESVALHRLTAEKAPELRRHDHFLARSYVSLGTMLHESGRLEESKRYLNDADVVYAMLVEDFPDRFQYRADWSHGLVQMTQCCLEAGDYEKARDTALRAVQLQEHLMSIQPTSGWLQHALVHALQLLGVSYRNLGEAEQSKQAFEKSLTIRPGNPEPLNSLSWTLTMLPDATQQELEYAVALVEQALQASPDAYHFWNTLAYGLARLEKWEETQVAVKKSMDLNNGGETLDWLVQAMVDISRGNRDSAQKWMDKAEEFQREHDPLNAAYHRISGDVRSMMEKASL